MKKKGLIVVLALLMALCVGAGATLAYLMDKTDEVVNTFEYGDINIDLKEDKLNADGTLDKNTPVNANTYKYVPGDTLNKRPYVVVKKDSEACYLFVKVVETNNSYSTVTDIIEWTVDTSIWTQVPGETNVWYKVIDATSADTQYDILTGDQVTVSEDLTKEMINADDFKTPTLTFTAYAVQKDNVANVTAAWAIANS